MKDIAKPTAEELQPYIAESLSDGQTIQEMVASFMPMLSNHLLKNPMQYRNFGPWWWTVKKAMIDAGYTPFGSEFDAEMVEAMAYPDSPEMATVAGVVYYEGSLENQFVGQATHVIVDNGEDVEYLVYDADAESFIAANN